MERIITEEEKEKVKRFYGEVFGKTDSVEIYHTVGPIYDQISDIIGFYQTAERVVGALCESVGTEDLSNIFIIDIGCGTGLVGGELIKKGIKNLHGLDISKMMIDICKEKSLYSHFFNVPLTVDPIPGISDNTYDVAVSVGCFVEGHIQMEAVREIIRIVKPGGHIIYTLNDPNYTKDYMAVHGRLIKEKLVELQKMELMPYKREYTQDYNWIHGYLIILKVL